MVNLGNLTFTSEEVNQLVQDSENVLQQTAKVAETVKANVDAVASNPIVNAVENAVLTPSQTQVVHHVIETVDTHIGIAVTELEHVEHVAHQAQILSSGQNPLFKLFELILSFFKLTRSK